MKKYLILSLIGIFSLFGVRVEACGEIKDLKSDVGSITTINESTYLVTVPLGTKEVVLEGSTDYKWVEGYEPRKLTVGEDAELKVDGFDCGYGIYTYFIKFKTASNLIAENEPSGEPQEPINPPTADDPNVIDPSTPSTTEENTLPLTKLEIKEVSIDFDPSIRNYSVSVDNKVTSLDIIAESQDATVTITVSSNANALEEGANVITINLEDTVGNKGVYTLVVTREKAKSSNNFLANITIDNYQLNFDTSITTYDLSIKKDKILNINAVTVSDKASFAILGNSNLNNGSVITIRVTAEDKTTRDYTINIIKKFNIMDYGIYILIGLLLLLLIVLLLISKKKKNAKKKMGPKELAPEESTAGVVQEIASQNGVQTDPVNTASMTPNETVQAGTLQIIEPTNIETSTEEQQPSQEDDGQTEVFQL